MNSIRIWNTCHPFGQKIPESKITGFEISPFPFGLPKFEQRSLGLNNLCFKRANFLEADLEAVFIGELSLPRRHASDCG